MFRGFHVYACAEATVARLVMHFIGDHLEPNPRNPWKFYQNGMEIVEGMRAARISGHTDRQTDTKPVVQEGLKRKNRVEIFIWTNFFTQDFLKKIMFFGPQPPSKCKFCRSGEVLHN